MKSNSIYLSGTIELEPWIFYERIFKKSNAIEIGFGKKWSDRQESELSKKTDQAQFYEGNIFMGGYKKYFSFHPSKHHFIFPLFSFIKIIILIIY